MPKLPEGTVPKINAILKPYGLSVQDRDGRILVGRKFPHTNWKRQEVMQFRAIGVFSAKTLCDGLADPTWARTVAHQGLEGTGDGWNLFFNEDHMPGGRPYRHPNPCVPAKLSDDDIYAMKQVLMVSRLTT